MNSIKTKILITLIAFLCTSCANVNNAKIDLKTLNSNPDKFGITVFRAIYVKEAKIVDAFENNQALPKQELSSVYINVKKNITPGENNKKEEYIISPTMTEESPEHQKLFITTSYNEKDEKVISINPDYFYAVKMLPEGNYYVNSIIIHKGIIRLEQNFDIKNSPISFSVKANKINYLGDLFLFAPEKVSTMLPAYKLKTKLFNKETETQDFLRQYHPKIDLLFYNNLINNKKDEITLDYVDTIHGGLLGNIISSAIDSTF